MGVASLPLSTPCIKTISLRGRLSAGRTTCHGHGVYHKHQLISQTRELHQNLIAYIRTPMHASYSVALVAPFKALERYAAWYRPGYLLTKLQDTLVEQAVAHKCYQVRKFCFTQLERSL